MLFCQLLLSSGFREFVSTLCGIVKMYYVVLQAFGVVFAPAARRSAFVLVGKLSHAKHKQSTLPKCPTLRSATI